MTTAPQLVTWRCTRCGRLLARVAPGSHVEIKCGRCGTLNSLQAA